MPQVSCQHTAHDPVACVVSNSAMAKHGCNSGVIETPNVPTCMLNVSMVELLKIMSHTQNNPRIKTQFFFSGHDHMRVCCRMCKETQTSRWNET